MSYTKEAYDKMINEVLEQGLKFARVQAENNRYKDEYQNEQTYNTPYKYRKGWKNFNMDKKLCEEVLEYIKSPNPQIHELGDIIWCCCMAIDNIREVF